MFKVLGPSIQALSSGTSCLVQGHSYPRRSPYLALWARSLPQNRRRL